MKKNNKKGFTLIELLAIIVILAIIAVITVPIILNIIDKSKKGAAFDSAYGIVDTAKNYYFKLDENVFETQSYTCTFPSNCDTLKYQGTTPTSGNIRVSDKGIINGEVTFFDKYTYCIFKNDVIEGTCSDTVAKNMKEEVKKSGTHIYEPNGALDIDKINSCIQFDIEVVSGTIIPFCVIGETTDTLTLITKEKVGDTQWNINNIYDKVLAETKGWTNIPVVSNYSYEDIAASSYKSITISNGELTIVYSDETQGTIGDSSNKLRGRILSKEEAYNIINGITNIKEKSTCNLAPSWLDSSWTISYGTTSTTFSQPGVNKSGFEVRNVTTNRGCGLLETAISDTSEIKPVITLAKSTLQ